MNILEVLQSRIESELTPRAIDGRYIPYQVQPLADAVLKNLSIEKLINLFDQAIEQDIEHVVNVIARRMVIADQERVKRILPHYSGTLAKYLKKHLKLRAWGVEREYSIADLITKRPNEVVVEARSDDVELYFSESITSLYGIQYLSKVVDVSRVTEFRPDYSDILDTPILDYGNDPDFPERPFDTFSRLSKLFISRWKSFPADLFHGLESLEQLELYENFERIDIPKGFFDGLFHLKHLTFVGMAVANLPESAFNDLKNLEELKLSLKRSLSSYALGFEVVFPIHIFSNLSRLKNLELSGCYISSLPEGIFDSLSQLKFLELANNDLNSLPQNVFNNLKNLEVLGLSANYITQLPQEIVAEMPRLKQLYLDHNKIEELLPNQFEGLGSLEHLWLNNNKIQSVHLGAFNKLHALKDLGLRSNNLTQLPAEVFHGLDSVESIGLDGNKLASLSPKTFATLSQLETLTLAENKLSALPEKLFEDLGHLEHLNLCGNNVSRLPSQIFTGLTQLKSLVLSGNSLHELPENIFFDLFNLEWLHLDSNKLTSLKSNTFDGLSKLRSLNLSKNQLNGLPVDLFYKIPQLKQLYSDHNNLENMPSAIFRHVSLEELGLSNNEKLSLPATAFARFSNLKFLNIKGCDFSEKQKELLRNKYAGEARNILLDDQDEEVIFF